MDFKKAESSAFSLYVLLENCIFVWLQDMVVFKNNYQE
jgi:hypothetical protein